MVQVSKQTKNKQTIIRKTNKILLINEGTPGELLQGLAKKGLTQGLGGAAGGTSF